MIQLRFHTYESRQWGTSFSTQNIRIQVVLRLKDGGQSELEMFLTNLKSGSFFEIYIIFILTTIV
jgi:hypothetical protein